MLESMTGAPRPTRAESTDVANAVLDGSDVVMLSGETAGGAYPLESCSVMARICFEAERLIDREQVASTILEKTQKPRTLTESIARSAAQTAHDIDAKLIICFS